MRSGQARTDAGLTQEGKRRKREKGSEGEREGARESGSSEASPPHCLMTHSPTQGEGSPVRAPRMRGVTHAA